MRRSQARVFEDGGEDENLKAQKKCCVYKYIRVGQSLDERFLGNRMLKCVFCGHEFQGNQFVAARHFRQGKGCPEVTDEALVDIHYNSEYKMSDKFLERIQRFEELHGPTPAMDPQRDEGGEGETRDAEEQIDVHDDVEEVARAGSSGRERGKGVVSEPGGQQGQYFASAHMKFKKKWLQFVYSQCLAFNVFRSEPWLDVVRHFRELSGPVKVLWPSENEIAGIETIVYTADDVGVDLAEIRAPFYVTGATIMSDGRKSRDARPIVNFLDGGSHGVMLVRTMNREGERDRAPDVLARWIKVFDDFPPKWVNAICTDSASAYAAAANMLQGPEKRPEHRRITWLPCATKKRNRLEFEKVAKMVEISANVRLLSHQRAGRGFALPWTLDESLLDVEGGIGIRPSWKGTDEIRTREELEEQRRSWQRDPCGSRAPPGDVGDVFGTRATTLHPYPRDDSDSEGDEDEPAGPATAAPAADERDAWSDPEDVRRRSGGDDLFVGVDLEEESGGRHESPLQRQRTKSADPRSLERERDTASAPSRGAESGIGHRPARVRSGTASSTALPTSKEQLRRQPAGDDRLQRLGTHESGLVPTEEARSEPVQPPAVQVRPDETLHEVTSVPQTPLPRGSVEGVVQMSPGLEDIQTGQSVGVDDIRPSAQSEGIAATTGGEGAVAGAVGVGEVEVPAQADPMCTSGGGDCAQLERRDADGQEMPQTLVVRTAVGPVVPHQAPFLEGHRRRAHGGGPVEERRVGRGACIPPVPTFAPSRERPEIRYVATPRGSLPFGFMTAEVLEEHGRRDLMEIDQRVLRSVPEEGKLPHVQDLSWGPASPSLPSGCSVAAPSGGAAGGLPSGGSVAAASGGAAGDLPSGGSVAAPSGGAAGPSSPLAAAPREGGSLTPRSVARRRRDTTQLARESLDTMLFGRTNRP
ncbi:hypothetical protein CBR_g29417 [Chara braunii]|uniref:DUF659 domain-containing protein n=1 Tax=Chara braunii TaxID=69332 RepID=A0A388LAB7_CHABU|nr:hypothetical protein CBR_g29417 [Chara braunii]|eukprot:GBG79265.1 hypothetical protein CBR_g29417 [Chara braunii]